MIAYHGGPITPERVAATIWRGRHAMLSFAYPEQLDTAAAVSQSFALDNGAYSEWKAGRPVDWDGYYAWVESWCHHPGFDFALIPDVIDGTEEDNDKLLYRCWPFDTYTGVPIWHLHEPVDRLKRLANAFHRVALGSSGRWATPGTNDWWSRIAAAMEAVCDQEGRPRCKLHGLRMLNPEITRHIPFSSADSTTVGRNINLDNRWTGAYQPRNKETRALVLAEYLEPMKPATTWKKMHIQDQLLAVYE